MDLRSQGMAAMNPMLLQHTLRGLCSNESQWIYAVFWRILPRYYPPPQWDKEGGIMDRSKGNKHNWILVWEDGFCNFLACAGTTHDSRGLSSSFLSLRQQRIGSNDELEGMNPDLFFKMSHEVYNYGEGLMGKVAVDNSHKWVFREPLENEISFFSSFHGSSIDPHPRTWEGQFKSGIQTIAMVAVQEGVLQLGSTKKIMEDLNFILFMQRKFNFLHSVPGVLVPHPSSSGGASKRGNGLLPLDGVHWTPEAESKRTAMANNQLNVTRPNDQFLLPGVAPDPWCPIVTTTAGMKKSLESLEALNSNQYSNLNGGQGSDQCTLECPSPPKALHTGLRPMAPHTLKPSMSSLQALLSKLPSVMNPPDSNDSCSYANNGNLEVISGGGLNDFNGNRLPVVSSDGSDLQRMVEEESMVTSPTNYSSVGNHEGEDVEDQQQNYRKMDAKEKHRYSSVLDSFDNFMEFGIQDELENGDSSYSSFLKDICS